MMRTLACVFLAGMVGCGKHAPPSAAVESTVYHKPKTTHPLLEGEQGPVAEAFAAKPLLELPAHVAVFSPDEALAEELAEALPGSQGIAGAHVLRGFLVDGRAHFNGHYPYASFFGPRVPMETDIEELRTLAAMAGCDALLLVDHSWRQDGRPNGWVVTTPLLLTLLFLPWLNLEYYGYLDMYLIDVQTGYLYGQITTEQTLDLGASTVAKLDNRRIIEQQRATLAEGSKDELSDLLWYHLMKAPVAAEER